MAGNEVYKFAVNAMSTGIKKVIAEAGLTEDDVDCADAAHLAPRHHLQPAVVLHLLLQVEAYILLEIAYHKCVSFRQIYIY